MDQRRGDSLFQSSGSPHRLSVSSAAIAEGGKQGENQKISREWFRSRGLQLPKEGTPRGNKNLRTEKDVVNRPINLESITINPTRTENRALTAMFQPSQQFPLRRRGAAFFTKAKPFRRQERSALGGPAVTSIVKPE
jgi:hypothetical protein